MAIQRNVRYVDAGNAERWHRMRDPFDPEGIQGIVSSEVSVVTGHNSYRTPLDLWQEKTGLKEPFKGNAATERGKANEAETRAWFAMTYKQFRVDYHEFGMYISGDLPLFSTLDGELTVLADTEFHCCDPRDGRPIALKLKKGEKGILEIKDTQPQTEESYLSWNVFPEMYRYQNAGQIRATGYSFVIDVAHITGPYADKGSEYRCYGFLDGDFLPEIKEIEDALPPFWECVKEKKQPGLVLFDSESLSLLQLNPDVRVGQIITDFEGAKRSVEKFVSQFEGVTFSQNEVKKAKDARAEINKYADSLNDMRLAVGKQWDAPYKEFKAKVDELISIAKKGAEPIDKFIKDAEGKRQSEKMNKINDAINRAIEETEGGTGGEIATALIAMGGIVRNPRWLNATFSMPDVEKEIRSALENIGKDLETIRNISGEDAQMHQSILQEYYRSRNLNDALNAKERIIAARKAAEDAAEKRQADISLAKKKLDEWNRKAEGNQEATATASPAEPKKEGKPISISIRFTHTDHQAFKDLLDYMKTHGFKYELI